MSDVSTTAKRIESSEWLLHLIAIVFGAWLALPMQTFDRDVYRSLSRICSEEVWSFYLLALGLMGIWSHVADSYVWRKRIHLLQACTWIGIGVGFAIQDIRAATASLFVLFGVTASLLYLRTGKSKT